MAALEERETMPIRTPREFSIRETRKKTITNHPQLIGSLPP
jgi:hypothetical protein